MKKMATERNTYTQNQEEATEIPWTHNEVEGLGKLNLHGVYVR